MKLSLKKPTFSIPHHWLVPNWQQEFSERRLLMLAVAVLACLGVTIVGSASMSIASADFNDPFYFFRRHLIYMFMAVTAAVIVANIPLALWRKWMPVILIVAGVLLVLVLTPLGKRVNGSARWLGVGPLTIQPSEVAKFAVVLYMSNYLVRRQDDVRKSLLALWRSALIVGATVGLLMGEPDFGASLVL
ncbi:MAG: FtsW/RodA/SpoVE family cell cycle protein, partial [Pseudomonadales bacterium]|nr:FtsW/RodA/SpoVE family cell cycle protein [Pseudomonadales bacterium]